MAQKRGKGIVLPERDRTALREFVDCTVPSQYFDLDKQGNARYDFNFNYQEIYEYAVSLLRGEEISLRWNFAGVPASAVNEDFKKMLDVLRRRNFRLEEFCDRFIRAISVIARYAE